MAWSNHFLDSLPANAVAEIERDLERLSLVRNELIVEVDMPVRRVILPVNSIISVIAVMENGDAVESRTIGKEGGFGLLHAIGSRTSFERVIVQVPGEAWAISVDALAQASRRLPWLVEAIVGHAQATIVQTANLTACNALHAAEPRLCRWLLMTADRLDSDIVPLTQEHLGIMLGVQRTTVTALASSLQDRKVISYRRGRIKLLDRRALKHCACECYTNITGSVRTILGEAANKA